MTVGVGYDLPTERPQAVIPGQIPRPVPIATTEAGGATRPTNGPQDYA